MIVLDIETSGSYPNPYGILSLGALDFENPDNCFYEECRLEDHHKIDPVALEINGFTEKQARDPSKKSIKQVLENFLEWMKSVREHTMASLGPSDWTFLYYDFQRHNLPWPFSFRIVDLHSLVYAHHVQRHVLIPLKYEVSHLTNVEILDYCGLKGLQLPHHGFQDAKLEAECFHRILYGKGMFKDYEEYTVPEYLRK